jgi:hypothetical protein
MTGKISKDQTEYDLETAISAAIEVAFPRLGAAGIKHQIEFTIRLGHATISEIDDVLGQHSERPNHAAQCGLGRGRRFLEHCDLEVHTPAPPLSPHRRRLVESGATDPLEPVRRSVTFRGGFQNFGRHVGACAGFEARNVFADLVEDGAQERGRRWIEHGRPPKEKQSYRNRGGAEFNIVKAAQNPG